jgi:hypothetical protein
MSCVLPPLSLPRFSSLGLLCSIFFVSVGSWVRFRYFLFRDEIRDQSNYRLYNVRIFSYCLVYDLMSVVHSRYGSSAFIFCGEWALPCVGIAVLPRCVRTMDFGCHWASVSSAWRSRIDCTYDASNHFGPRCSPPVYRHSLQATEIF